MRTIRKHTVASLLAALALGLGTAGWGVGDAAAAGPSYDLSNRLRIEQDIRRQYNNYNRNVPVSPVVPRIRERHLSDSVVPAPTPRAMEPSATTTDACANAFDRWKRTGSKYWRDRYRDCE